MEFSSSQKASFFDFFFSTLSEAQKAEFFDTLPNPLEVVSQFYAKKAAELRPVPVAPAEEPPAEEPPAEEPAAEEPAAEEEAAPLPPVALPEEDEDSMKVVPAISVACCYHISDSLKPRSHIARDLSDFVYADGRTWVGFSYHQNLKSAGLDTVNLVSFLEDCKSSKEKRAKLCAHGLTETVADNIVFEIELFQTPGSLFVRKVSASKGGGLDLCRVVGPYHFVPYVEDRKLVDFYAHRCVYEKIRDLTEAEKAYLETCYTNARKMEQIIFTSIEVPSA